MCEWWCASAVPEGIHLWGGGCFYTKGMMQMWTEGTHQEKLTVPFITIDHYISLFVTFVAISAIIAL